MRLDFHSQLSTEDQVQILHPLFLDFITKVISIYSKKHDLNLCNCAKFYIKSEREMADLSRPHVMIQNWELFDAYFHRKSHLFCFIEKPSSGLVSTKPKLWFFPDIALARSFFFKQGEKPNEFNKTSIERLPFIDFGGILSEEIEKVKDDPDLKKFNIVEQSVLYLGLSEKYLSSEERAKFYRAYKVSLSEILKGEITDLKQLIQSSVKGQKNLEKRLKRIFKIGWKFYRIDNPLENSYFKRILSPQPDQRLKGLGLAQKKIEDFLSNQ